MPSLKFKNLRQLSKTEKGTKSMISQVMLFMILKFNQCTVYLEIPRKISGLRYHKILYQNQSFLLDDICLWMTITFIFLQ
jgi:hypothetical protein